MRHVRLGDSYLVRLDTDEEVVGAITRFAAEEKIDAGSLTGIGAVRDIVLGYFDRSAREYLRQTLTGEWEILSLSGNLALKDGRPFAHLHVTLGGREFQTLGGHLFEARVGATVELVVRPLPGYQLRTLDDATGLYLLDL